MVKDAHLFAAAMSEVKPLKGRKPASRAKTVIPRPKAEGPSRPHKRSLAGLGMTKEPELSADDQNFDRDTSRALSRGKLVPQASLDLHGMTLAAAERAVAAFLEHATTRDLRVVLIVTGKGLRLEGGRMLGGRIRAEFVGWLNRADNRHRVRAVRAAHPRHGGGGAFYVLLRRRSSASNRSLRATPQR
ncbi:DNA mismatch repair protein MutS [Reyranella soli]|jgi:DNA-nicking Smr family endonuclease|uniref:DNA mismatch repair protein MutS n=2 Tax=Reyranella soli TaxID=1230389 RepID=A0A512NIQ2_9HYPH|nr:DNA mismatch repair protein MutS [Reyranella soli]